MSYLVPKCEHDSDTFGENNVSKYQANFHFFSYNCSVFCYHQQGTAWAMAQLSVYLRRKEEEIA